MRLTLAAKRVDAMTFSEAIRARRRGSRDGAGAGDHDKPYTFGHRPTVAAPFPFSTRELALLLVLRSRSVGGACVQPVPDLERRPAFERLNLS